MRRDEDIDTSKKSLLLCYIGYQFENIMSVDHFFITLIVHLIAEDIYHKINGFIMANKICVGEFVCIYQYNPITNNN